MPQSKVLKIYPLPRVSTYIESKFISREALASLYAHQRAMKLRLNLYLFMSLGLVNLVMIAAAFSSPRFH